MNESTRCSKCGGWYAPGFRHKHENPEWEPPYDDFEGVMEGYETEPIPVSSEVS